MPLLFSRAILVVENSIDIRFPLAFNGGWLLLQLLYAICIMFLIHSKLSQTMLVAEKPLSSDMDEDDNDPSDDDNKTYQQSNPSNQSSTKSYLEIWKHGLYNSNYDGNKNDANNIDTNER